MDEEEVGEGMNGEEVRVCDKEVDRGEWAKKEDMACVGGGGLRTAFTRYPFLASPPLADQPLEAEPR